jgi:hypothetical protein
MTLKARTANIGFSDILASEYVLSFLFAYQHLSRLTE